MRLWTFCCKQTDAGFLCAGLMRTLLILSLYVMMASSLIAQQPLNIWQDTQCKAKVRLTPFLAGGKNNIAVVVCPGGSYCWHDLETEGTDVARWLQQNGISAFVLEYRTAGVWSYVTHDRIIRRGHQYPDMMEDVQRAIELLRINAEEYGIDPRKVGVMGFSAGGHLAMSSGLFFDTDFLAPHGIVCSVSLRPDFVVPVYPVVSMSNKEYTHKRSRRGTLGEWRKRKAAMRDSLSLEKKVRPDAPPVFLVNCVDDPVVRYQNSELLDSALTAVGVPHEYIQYKTGGHGFGASGIKGTEECRHWKDEFLRWLNSIMNNSNIK